MMRRRTRSKEGKRDLVSAVQAIHRTLEPFEAEERERVLSAVAALLGNERGVTAKGAPDRVVAIQAERDVHETGRLKSIRECIDEAEPATNPQYLAVFAYYREKVEG